MVHLGFQLHSQNAMWTELRDAALLVEQLGYDSLWSSDHFMPWFGDETGANLEGWQLLPAWGALTRRVRIGMLVSGAAYRHPAVLAKMVATLDHITDGRAILGIGAGWLEREHDMYGLPFGTPGERLARLGEAVPVIRSLLDEPRTTFRGRYYHLEDALAQPKPLQRHLPILVGGGGERHTLRIAAQYADLWHVTASPAEITHKIEVLRRHCAELGRDLSTITPLTGGSVIVRPDAESWQSRADEIRGRHRLTAGYTRLRVTPPQLAQLMAESWRGGARGFIFASAAPFDRETIERIMTEVQPRFEAIIAH